MKQEPTDRTIREAELYPEAVAALESCLRSVPFLRLCSVHHNLTLPQGVKLDTLLDFLLTGQGEGAPQVLIAELKSSGYPGVARPALEQLRYYGRLFQEQDTEARQPVLVFVAPFISEETANLCREQGIGYVDLAGNCLLSFDTVYIERRGNPNPFTREQNRKTLFAPKAERALRVLMREPGRAWQVQELAREAAISLGTASDVKKLLQERDWVRADRNGIRLTRPEALLAEWAERYDYRRSKARDFYSLKPPAETEAAIAAACRDRGAKYAFTGFSGAARHAAFVRYNKATAYVAHDIEEIAWSAKLKEVKSGANVTLLTPYDEGVFLGSEEVNGETVASPLQVYLDLQHAPARGAEAAERLFHQKIEPTWSQSHADES